MEFGLLFEKIIGKAPKETGTSQADQFEATKQRVFTVIEQQAPNSILIENIARETLIPIDITVRATLFLVQEKKIQVDLDTPAHVLALRVRS